MMIADFKRKTLTFIVRNIVSNQIKVSCYLNNSIFTFFLVLE